MYPNLHAQRLPPATESDALVLRGVDLSASRRLGPFAARVSTPRTTRSLSDVDSEATCVESSAELAKATRNRATTPIMVTIPRMPFTIFVIRARLAETAGLAFSCNKGSIPTSDKNVGRGPCSLASPWDTSAIEIREALDISMISVSSARATTEAVPRLRMWSKARVDPRLRFPCRLKSDASARIREIGRVDIRVVVDRRAVRACAYAIHHAATKV
jgi:hypothetical protein